MSVSVASFVRHESLTKNEPPENPANYEVLVIIPAKKCLPNINFLTALAFGLLAKTTVND
jgi:hypothetical protein